ncbi:MAG: porin, partial [Hydrogenophaga sp.]|nr:porin [Hydrogenophaga sp.]
LGEGAQSRFGFRGVEDLGQGMKVSFALENRFRSNSGELTAVRFFQGQAILAIEGGWGRVALGRDYVAG